MPSAPSRRRVRGSHLYQRRVGERLVWYAYVATTPPQRVSLRTSDRGEAERAFRALLLAGPERVGAATAPESTLRDLLSAYLDAPHGWTHSTQDSARRRLDALGRRLTRQGVRYVSEITTTLLDAWLSARREDVTHRTINRDLRALRLAVAWGAERGYCRACPALDRPYLREAIRRPRRALPSPLEVARVLEQLALEDAAEGARRGHRGGGLGLRRRDAAIAVATLYATGLRIAELQRLRREHLHNGVLHVGPEAGAAADAAPTKGYRERTIPLAPASLAFVEAWLARAEQRQVVVGESWLLKRLGMACTRAGVPLFGLHDLRRAFATEAHRAGVPVLTISTWLGHRSVRTTELYLGVYRSDLATIAPVPGGLTVQSVSNTGVDSGRFQSLPAPRPALAAVPNSSESQGSSELPMGFEPTTCGLRNRRRG